MTRLRFPNLSKAKRGAGRQYGEVNLRNDTAQYVAALMREEERRLKAQGEWAFRLKAQPYVRARLIAEGYSKKWVEKLDLTNTRPRGKKKGGP